jgi:hypothetical protein
VRLCTPRSVWRAFDIILMSVSSSTLSASVVAAHLRAIERQKARRHHRVHRP